MTTVELELEPVIDDRVLEHDRGETRFCHLYRHETHVSICGQVPHDVHAALPWAKGTTRCTGCGQLICLECLLAVS